MCVCIDTNIARVIITQPTFIYVILLYIVRGQSESHDLLSSFAGTASNHTLCMLPVGSAESMPKHSCLLAHFQSRRNRHIGADEQIVVTTKKPKFINPFDPLKVHGELAAYHRRWVHAFPRDKHGLAFQAHHVIHFEVGEEENGELLSFNGSTFSPMRKISSFGSSIAETSTRVDGKGSPFSNEHDAGTLSQGGSRSRYISGSSSVGDMLLLRSPGSPGSHEECKAHGPSTARYLHNLHAQSDRWDDYGIRPEALSESSNIEPPTMRSVMYREKKKLALTKHHVSRTLEDFTSVKRTGVDWASLIEPACLPVTVDFFPSESKLNQDYYQSPTKLLVSSYSSESDMATGLGYV